MAQFVGHNTRHLTFVAGGFNHAPVHVHRPAGQSEGIDVTDIENLEVVLKFRMLKLWRYRRHQSLAHLRNVISGLAVPQNRHLPFSFLRRLPAELDIVLRFELIAVITDLCLRKDRHRQEKIDTKARPAMNPWAPKYFVLNMLSLQCDGPENLHQIATSMHGTRTVSSRQPRKSLALQASRFIEAMWVPEGPRASSTCEARYVCSASRPGR